MGLPSLSPGGGDRTATRLGVISANRIAVAAVYALVVVAVAFRVYDLNWDGGRLFHTDEVFIASAVTRIRFFSHMDPEYFDYGGLTIYLYRLAAEVVAFFTADTSWTSDWSRINIIGRAFSAVFSSLTMVPVYLLTRELADRRSAIVATLLFGFAVASIQTAHYAVTETLLTLIGVAVVLLSVRAFRVPTRRSALSIGILLGAGIATKTAAIAFAAAPLAAYSLAAAFPREGGPEGSPSARLLGMAKKLLVVGLTAFATFFLLSPFSLLSFDKFVAAMTQLSDIIVTGAFPIVWTFQFDGTTPYVFQLQNLIWQLGPVAIICTAAFLLLIVSMIRTRNRELAVFLAFPVLYFLYVGSWHAKFSRYMVPLVPYLLIAGAILMGVLIARFRRAGAVLAVASLVVTIAWACAFVSIYTRPQTRIAASEWIYANIPAGTRIRTEQWDDTLPLSLGNQSPERYDIEQMDIYSPDDDRKAGYLADSLASADYLVFNSRRLYGTLIHLEEKYPITSRYYKLLFDGQLGYAVVAQFASYPAILGFEINDDSSEETFQIWDHPKVLVLRNEQRLDAARLTSILEGG